MTVASAAPPQTFMEVRQSTWSDHRPRSIDEIRPDYWYTVSRLFLVELARGRMLVEALQNDPSAPIGLPLFNAKLFPGDTLLAYCREYVGEDAPRTASETASILRSQRAAIQATISKAIARLSIAEEDAKQKADLRINDMLSGAIFEALDKAQRADIDDVAICGVYFLYHEGVLQYVGQSVNVLGRIGQHKKEKKFDECRWIVCAQELLSDYEGFFIRLLRPPLNMDRCGNICAPTSQTYNQLFGGLLTDLRSGNIE